MAAGKGDDLRIRIVPMIPFQILDSHFFGMEHMYPCSRNTDLIIQLCHQIRVKLILHTPDIRPPNRFEESRIFDIIIKTKTE